MSYSVKGSNGTFYSGKGDHKLGTIWGAVASNAHRFATREEALAFAKERRCSEEDIIDLDEVMVLEFTRAEVHKLRAFVEIAERAAFKLAVSMIRGEAQPAMEYDMLVGACGQVIKLGHIEPRDEPGFQSVRNLVAEAVRVMKVRPETPPED